MKLTREFYIVKGARKVTDKHSTAVAYVYEREGRPFAQMFVGKAAKPAQHYRYKNEADRAGAIGRFFKSAQAIAATKAEYKAKREQPHTLEVGHILSSSWGYEQTNVDFYQVTRVISGRSVEVRKIKSTLTEGDHYHSGKAMPLIDEFCGEPRVHRVTHGRSISLNSYSSASVWNGKPVFCSFYA